MVDLFLYNALFIFHYNLNAMKKGLFILLVCFILFPQCAKKIGLSSNLISGSWNYILSSDNSTPEKRHEAGFTMIGDKFYLVGGRGMKPVSIYDTKTKKWTDGAIAPIEMHHFQPVVFNNEIYVVGAMTGPYPGETPVPNIYIYSPIKNEWRKGDLIPEHRRRGGAGLSLHGNKLYLVCGIKDGHRGDHKKWLDTYDLITGEWAELPDAPRARDHFQSVISENILYAAGGRTTISSDNPFKNTIGEVDVYDINKRNWVTLDNDIPTPRAGTASMTLNDEVLVFGGESFSQELAHNEVEALDIHKKTWRSLPPMIKGRHGTGAVLFNNQIYLSSGCGNRGGKPELNDLISFSF